MPPAFHCFWYQWSKLSTKLVLSFYADVIGDSSNIERVRQHYLFLVEKLDLKFSGLLYQLYADDVVDVQEMEDLTSQQTSARQNERFLCLLSRKSFEQFQTFLRDLDSSGQSHIRNTLENRQGFSVFLYTGHSRPILFVISSKQILFIRDLLLRVMFATNRIDACICKYLFLMKTSGVQGQRKPRDRRDVPNTELD